MIVLYTKNCIVTGKPAKVFSGHLKGLLFDGTKISIIAGFVDYNTKKEFKSSGDGYCGEWKESYGIKGVGI